MGVCLIFIRDVILTEILRRTEFVCKGVSTNITIYDIWPISIYVQYIKYIYFFQTKKLYGDGGCTRCVVLILVMGTKTNIAIRLILFSYRMMYTHRGHSLMVQKVIWNFDPLYWGFCSLPIAHISIFCPSKFD